MPSKQQGRPNGRNSNNNTNFIIIVLSSVVRNVIIYFPRISGEQNDAFRSTMNEKYRSVSIIFLFLFLLRSSFGSIQQLTGFKNVKPYFFFPSAQTHDGRGSSRSSTFGSFLLFGLFRSYNSSSSSSSSSSSRSFPMPTSLCRKARERERERENIDLILLSCRRRRRRHR